METNKVQTQELAEITKASLASYRKLLDDKVLRSRLSIILGTQSAIDDFEMYFSKVLSVNESLLNCNINSLFNSVVQAWKQRLVIGGQNSDACIIPYGNQAQLQMEWRGLLRLAKLADPSLELHITEIVENEIASYDAENDKYEFNKLNFLERLHLKDAGKLLGFYGRLRSNYCTELQIFMSEAELARHGSTYSKSYNDKGGAWQKAGLQMKYKTIAKKLLNRFLLHYNGQAAGTLKWALAADQATFEDNGAFNYIDNPPLPATGYSHAPQPFAKTIKDNFTADTDKAAAVAAFAGAFAGTTATGCPDARAYSRGAREDPDNHTAPAVGDESVPSENHATKSAQVTKNLSDSRGLPHVPQPSAVAEEDKSVEKEPDDDWEPTNAELDRLFAEEQNVMESGLLD